MRDTSADILFWSFLQALVSSSGMRGGYPLFDVVSPGFALPTTVSPTLQGAMKGGFGEAVVTCNMPKPCKFPSLDSCQKRFLLTHKDLDLAPHPVFGLLFQLGDTEKLPHALAFERLDPFSFFFKISKELSMNSPASEVLSRQPTAVGSLTIVSPHGNPV